MSLSGDIQYGPDKSKVKNHAIVVDILKVIGINSNLGENNPIKTKFNELQWNNMNDDEFCEIDSTDCSLI